MFVYWMRPNTAHYLHLRTHRDDAAVVCSAKACALLLHQDALGEARDHHFTLVVCENQELRQDSSSLELCECVSCGLLDAPGCDAPLASLL